jgi:hypothetical protein
MEGDVMRKPFHVHVATRRPAEAGSQIRRIIDMSEAKTFVLDMCRVARVEAPPAEQLDHVAADLVLLSIEALASPGT